MSPAATGSPTIFAGSGSEVTEPFVVDASWMLRWESSSWMSAFVIRDESDSHVAWFPGVDEGGQGESPVYAGGTFVLDVSALQDTTWTLTVEDLEEWPKAQLPLSVAGTAAVNTAGFESSEDLQICWQYEGTSNFIVDLVGLGPSQREDNQSIVNSLGHSSDCARLSPGWPQSYLEIVATGGEWQITIAVAGSP